MIELLLCVYAFWVLASAPKFYVSWREGQRADLYRETGNPDWKQPYRRPW